MQSILLSAMIDYVITHPSQPPNGVRYPRVGGTRQRHFAGANFKPRKLLKNAARPTRRVHAVLGGDLWIINYFTSTCVNV